MVSVLHFVRITKAIFDDENAVISIVSLPIWSIRRRWKMSSIGQPAIIGAHGIVRPVNIPLSEAELKKTSISSQLKDIINDASNQKSLLVLKTNSIIK